VIEQKENLHLISLRRLLWGALATLEFVVAFLIGIPLFLGTALYFAGVQYVRCMRGAVKRGVLLWRYRMGLAEKSPRASAVNDSGLAAIPRPGQPLFEQRQTDRWTN
jgi:hypothetical protein